MHFHQPSSVVAEAESTTPGLVGLVGDLAMARRGMARRGTASSSMARRGMARSSMASGMDRVGGLCTNPASIHYAQTLRPF